MVDHVESPGRARITKVHTRQGCGTGRQCTVTSQDSVVSTSKPRFISWMGGQDFPSTWNRVTFSVDHTLLFAAADSCDPVLRSAFWLGQPLPWLRNEANEKRDSYPEEWLWGQMAQDDNVEKPFSTCGSQHLHRDHRRLACIPDIYIVIQIVTKLQPRSSNENNFMGGGHHHRRDCIKGLQH